MVDYINLIPLAAIVFGAGALYQKFCVMEKDFKSIKDQLNDIGESKSIHDQLIKSQQAAFSAFLDV